MLVPSAFEAAVDRRPADFTDGAQERDFLFIDDLVAWIAGGLSWPGAGDGPGCLEVHHLGTGVGTPVRDVLTRIARFFPGASFRLGALPRRAGEPDRQVALSRPAPWPWTPRIGIDEGLAATAAWWHERAAIS
jgi:GDP-L-fucose synthase